MRLILQSFVRRAVAAVVVGVALNAHALVTTWDAASGQAPDQVAAWELVDSYASINPTFVSGALQLGATGSFSPNMIYRMTGADLSFADGPSFWVEASVRVLNGAHTSGWWRSPAVIGVRFDNGRQAVLDIDPNRFYLRNGDNSVDATNGLKTGVDNTDGFHTFRMEVAGTASGSIVKVYRDGVLALTDNSVFNFGGSGAVFFGEGSILASGQSQWKSFSHNMAAVASPVVAVPEPQTYALMLAGLCAVGLMSRNSRSDRV